MKNEQTLYMTDQWLVNISNNLFKRNIILLIFEVKSKTEASPQFHLLLLTIVAIVTLYNQSYNGCMEFMIPNMSMDTFINSSIFLSYIVYLHVIFAVSYVSNNFEFIWVFRMYVKTICQKFVINYSPAPIARNITLTIQDCRHPFWYIHCCRKVRSEV